MAIKLLCCGFFSVTVAMRTSQSHSLVAEGAAFDIASASALAVNLLRDGLAIEMTEDEAKYALEADPELYKTFADHSGFLRADQGSSDVSESLLERAAAAVQSTAHKQALDVAVAGKDNTECVCMLRAKRVVEKGWFTKFKVDLMVPLIDFDEKPVNNCDQCLGQCKTEEKYGLKKEQMIELGFDNAEKAPVDIYVAAQCGEDGCLCLDAEQTVKHLRAYKNSNATVDVAFERKVFKGDSEGKACMKSCKALCDQYDHKDADVEGVCMDELIKD